MFRSILVVFSSILILAGSSSYAQEEGIQFLKTDWENTLRAAAKQDKLIFMDAYASWCGPCKWMSKNVFTDPEVAAFYNANFINVKVDMEKGEGIELSKRYKVNSYPTLLFIDAAGNVVHRKCGAAKAESFIELGETAKNGLERLANLEKTYRSGEWNASFMQKFFSARSEACISYQDEIESYFAAQNDEQKMNKENFSIILDYVNNQTSGAFKYLMLNKEKFVERYTAEVVDEKIAEVYENSLNAAAYKGEEELFNELASNYLKSGNENAEYAVLKSELTLLSKKKDWNAYARKADQLFERHDIKDFNFLNGLAWDIYENVESSVYLEKAEKWIEKSVSINENWYNLDTWAAVLYKQGKKKPATKIAKRAIKIAEDSGEDASETEDLLVKIKAL